MKNSYIGLIVAVFMLGGLATVLFVGANNTSHATTAASATGSTIASVKNAQVPTDVYASRDNRSWGGVYMFNPQAKAGQPQYQPMTQSTGGHLVNYSQLPPLAQDAAYQKWNKFFSEDGSFTSNDGKTIYHQSCAGCHLHQGQGGFGAGYYPPLANNPKMHSAEYVYSILLNGLRGMPYFRDMLNDEQIAAVTKYVQEDLNGFKSTANAKDVAALRHHPSTIVDPSDH